MVPPCYMRSAFDWNAVMRRVPVFILPLVFWCLNIILFTSRWASQNHYRDCQNLIITLYRENNSHLETTKCLISKMYFYVLKTVKHFFIQKSDAMNPSFSMPCQWPSVIAPSTLSNEEKWKMLHRVGYGKRQMVVDIFQHL
jgi:hypothetical protein